MPLRNIQSLGQEQYNRFVEERLVSCIKPITDTLSKNNLPLLSFPKSKAVTKEKSKVAQLKSDRGSFSKLYIASQTRDGNLEDFFKHDNQPYPPSISEYGALRTPTAKGDLLSLESSVPKVYKTPDFDAVFMDGPAVVNYLMSKDATTFSDYAVLKFLPHINYYLHTLLLDLTLCGIHIRMTV